METQFYQAELESARPQTKKQAKSIAYENATHFHLPLNMTFS
ncbi:hypothetical protein C7S16_3829 [Burkholderia thailandensis]|uniref:Uncharacterized protein n=1 Tax=Burkholderia thailandensis TaxID=57975 RepID=A0AAW9D5N2_BURTH|nr:hypothetical protein [Burkholderia thailandensis]MDW9257286.1 hypothetical protein [Burkholderia thailandensis]